MATFRVTGPDGAVYNVTAPDGASDADVMQMVQSQAKSAPTAPSTSAGEAALIGAGKAFTRLGQGAQQAFYGLTGDQDALAALKARVAEGDRLFKPLQEEHPIATAIGEAAPVVTGGPLTMAGAGALEYGTPEEKAMRAAGGFVGGKVGELGGKLVGRALQPVRSATADATQALFDKFNLPALAGQITQSAPLQYLESTLAKLPGGGRIRDVMAQQQAGVNKAAMGTMGSSADAVTPETVGAAKGRRSARRSTRFPQRRRLTLTAN
jgi:hypothetical protein